MSPRMVVAMLVASLGIGASAPAAGAACSANPRAMGSLSGGRFEPRSPTVTQAGSLTPGTKLRFTVARAPVDIEVRIYDRSLRFVGGYSAPPNGRVGPYEADCGTHVFGVYPSADWQFDQDGFFFPPAFKPHTVYLMMYRPFNEGREATFGWPRFAWFRTGGVQDPPPPS